MAYTDEELRQMFPEMYKEGDAARAQGDPNTDSQTLGNISHAWDPSDALRELNVRGPGGIYDPSGEKYYKYVNTRSEASDESARRAAAAGGTSNIHAAFNAYTPGDQQQAFSSYQQAAQGLGPSQAGAQMQGANDALYRQQAMGQMQAHGGLQSSMAQRAAMSNALMGGQGNAMQAGQMAGHEQNVGLQGMNGMANAIRGQDIEQGLGAAKVDLRNQGLNDQQVKYWKDLEIRQRLAQLEAMKAHEGQMSQGMTHGGQAFYGQYAANSARDIATGKDIMNAGAATATGIGAATSGGDDKSSPGYINRDNPYGEGGSDERFKKGITPSDGAVRQMLDSLHPYSYEYKDPEKHGEGRRLGIMAQDMEKTGLGRSVVQNRSDGKYIDLNKATSLSLAGIASLNRRLDALERSDSDDE